MSTFVHGIAASENIDSSGERIIIAGLDISSLDKDGVLNWEHKADQPAQVVGKILKARKIFSDADCQDEHQLYFWHKCKTPYLYVMGELMDDYKDSAREVAGQFKYDADRKDQNEKSTSNFSIEGAKIEKVGIDIVRSIARKVTITVMACNKAAIAEIVPEKKKKKDDLSSLFKTEEVEIEVLQNTDKNKLFELLKKEDPKKHASKLGIDPFIKDEVGLATGASSGLSGAGPTSPSLSSSEQNMKDKPKLELVKALDAGSALAAPSQLTQGAALGKQPRVHMAPVMKPQGVKPSKPGSPHGQVINKLPPLKKKDKSKWLARAEQEYEKWEKKEQFRNFMQKKMPKLAMGEIDAIGKTLALKKSIEQERALAKIMPQDESLSKKEEKK